METKYAYISSTQNGDIYPDNVWYDFSVELPMELKFNDSCKCAVVEFSVEPSMLLDVNVFCDLVEGSCFESIIAPFIFKAKESPAFINIPQFHNVINPSVKNFRIYMRSGFKNLIPIENIQAVNIVLAFQS